MSFKDKDCASCGRSFQPTAAAQKRCAECRKSPARSGAKHTAPKASQNGAPPADVRERYLLVLLARAESEPSDELFDRIERVMGLATTEPAA